MAGKEIADCIAAGILAVTGGGRTRDIATLDGDLCQEIYPTIADDCTKPAFTGGLIVGAHRLEQKKEGSSYKGLSGVSVIFRTPG